MSIAPINAFRPPVAPELPAELPKITGPGAGIGVEGTSPRPDIAGSFEKALADAHAAEHQATGAAEQFAKGDPSMGIHEVVIASEKANIQLRFATTVKNKALEAYRELMNTQV
jgi:flagellar hook-basal body complex protein FliE